MPQVKANVRDLVLRALENPDYTWRTVPGISSDTGLDNEIVKTVLKACGDQVIQSEITSEDGEELYTTRSHYRAKAPLWKRVLGALKNRAD